MNTPEQRYLRLRTTALAAWGAIGILVLVVAGAYGLIHISSALVPFVLAFVFVFLLGTPVNMLADRGMSRGVATLLCILGIFAVVGGVLTFVIPPIGREAVAFVGDVPKYFDQVQALITDLSSRFTSTAAPVWLSDVTNAISQQTSSLALSIGNGIAKGIVTAGSTMATGIFDLAIGFVIAFWTLRDLPKIRAELQALAGPKYEQDLEQGLATVTRVVGGYMKGQTIASLVTAAIATIGLVIIGVPYALVLGPMVFIFNYVPYIGPFISGVIAGLVGLFVGPWVGVGAVIVVVVAQNFTDNVITPRVMSEQVDLHPTLVIFSLLVGGSLFGIAGMLLAIPVAATAKGLFVYYYQQRTQRQLVSEDGALFRSVACEPESEEPDADVQPSAEGSDDTLKDTRSDT